MSKFRELLTKDAGWKLLSVFIAVCLWFVVINMENPVEYRVFTANIDIVNISAAEEAGMTITNAKEIENTKVSVRLMGKRIVLDKIQQNRSFSAYIDVSSIDMENAEGKVTLPVKIKTGLLASDYVDMEFISPSDVDVELDENVSKNFKIEAVFSGSSETGVTIDAETIDPEYVKIYGAQTDVNKVATVKAAVNLDSPHNGQKVTAPLAAYDISGNVVDGIYLSNDTAVVTLKMETSRKVPVQINYTGQPANGCSVGKITLSPEYVMVTGNPDVINELIYITLPSIDVSRNSNDIDKVFDVSSLLPDGAELADGSTGRISVNVQIIGQEEHDITFDSDDIMLTGDVENGCNAEIEKDSFNIEVTGSSFNESQVKYTVDVSNLTEGEHRVQVKVLLPDGCSLNGNAPYATVVVKSNGADSTGTDTNE